MSVICLVCLFVGYLFGRFIGGVSEGEPGRVHWEWFLKTFRVHIHHWMSATMVLVFYLATYTTNRSYPLIAFIVGVILQGLTYADRFDIGVRLS